MPISDETPSVSQWERDSGTQQYVCCRREALSWRNTVSLGSPLTYSVFFNDIISVMLFAA